MNSLVAKLFRLAWILGMSGGLVDATQTMIFEAGHAHQTGLISLKALNHQLYRSGIA